MVYFYFYLYLIFFVIFIQIFFCCLNLVYLENFVINLKYYFYFKLYPNFKLKKTKKNIKSTIIVCNHYTVHDGMILSYQFDNIYFVAKDNIFKSNYNNFIFNFLNQYIYKVSRWIPYKRGDKFSGSKCRSKIIDLLNNGNNVCIFPEGKSQFDGIPLNFYNGIFEIAKEHKFDIIPCALYYKPAIGIDPGTKINLYKDYKLSPIVYFNIFDKIVTKDNTLSSIELNKKVNKIITDYVLIKKI